MAELMLKIKRDAIPDPAYQDGDIMCALNDRRILDVHTQHVCSKRLAGFNSEGLRPANSLTAAYLESVMQYKFERISRNEVRRVNLWTAEETVLSNTPNHSNEHIDVALYLSRRRSHSEHLIFGVRGSEFWYGGYTNASLSRLSTVWDTIESRTPHKRASYTRWPFTANELKNYLILSVPDFTDLEGSILTSPVLDESDLTKLESVIVKRRKRYIAWKDLADSSIVVDDILNRNKTVDIRSAKQFDRTTLIQEKV